MGYMVFCRVPNLWVLIVFERKEGADCIASFIDFNYVGDLDKRRSTSSYVFTIVSRPVS